MEKRILIIEDNPEVVKSLGDELKEKGYGVFSAHSEKEAVKISKEHHPHLIMLDWTMPEVSSVGILRKLKKDVSTMKIPVIALAEESDLLNLDAASRLFIEKCIRKPVVVDQCVLEVEKFLSHNAEIQGAILVVDDRKEDREWLAKTLADSGHLVSTAEQGSEAVQLIREKKFDLVVLNIQMPVMNGMEVLRQIREHYTLTELPVIMISEGYNRALVVRSFMCGANDYLVKPIVLPVFLPGFKRI